MEATRTVTTDQTLEPLTLGEIKSHLHIAGDQHDAELMHLAEECRDYLERIYSRTLRTTVTRCEQLAEFPTGRRFLYAPLIDVTSVTYYDESNSQQTLASTNYHVITSTNSCGQLVWAHDAVLPATYTRPDAVQINYTTGYASRSVIPSAAKLAIKTLINARWYETDPAKLAQCESAALRLMDSVDWGVYR